MGIFKKKYDVKIAQDDLNDAKLSSAVFEEENVRKKAFIDVLGARLAMKLLFSKKIQATNLYSLYTIHNILGQLDISDIYHNGIKMDVRVVFDKNEIFIPKSQFEYGILPDLYLVLALSQDYSAAELLGYFEPKNIDKSQQNEDFYFVEQENLTKPDQLKKYLSKLKIENNFQATEEDYEKAESLFVASIDHEISKEDKTFLVQQLANSFDLREKFIEFENFELISKQVAKDESLFNDGVLDIIGGQSIFDKDEADGLQIETINIGDKDDQADSDENVIEGFFEGDKKPKASNNDNLSGAIAEIAITAGSAALAGGFIAAGASALAHGAAASSVTSIANSVVDLGSSVASAFNSDNNCPSTANIAEVKSTENIFEFEESNEELETVESIEELDEIFEQNELDIIENNSELEIEESNEDLETIESIEELEELFEQNELEVIENNSELEFEESDEELETVESIEELDEIFEQNELDIIENNSELEFEESDEDLEAIESIEELEELFEQNDLDIIENNSELEFEESDEEIETIQSIDELDEVFEQNDLDAIENNSELEFEESDEEIETVESIDELDEVFEQNELDNIENNSELEFEESDEDLETVESIEELGEVFEQNELDNIENNSELEFEESGEGLETVESIEELDEVFEQNELDIIENNSELEFEESDEELETVESIEELDEVFEQNELDIIENNSELEFEESDEDLETIQSIDELEEVFETIVSTGEEADLSTPIADNSENEFELFEATEELPEVLEEIFESELASEDEFLDETIEILTQSEDNLKAENIHEEIELFELPVTLFTPLEEISEADLTDLAPLEGLPTLEDYKEINENENKQSNTVDLDNFDFGMFDEENIIDESTKQVQNEGTVSFDELTASGEENIKVTESDFDSTTNELNNEDIKPKSQSDELNNISSQVDNLMSDTDFSEVQSSILESENGINDDITSLGNSKLAQAEKDQNKISSDNEMDIALLTATGPLEKDKDLLKALFEAGKLSEETDSSEQLDFGDRDKVPNTKLGKKKKMIIAASIASVMLISIAAGGIILNNKNKDVEFPASTQNSPISPEMQEQVPTAPGSPGMDGQLGGLDANVIDQGPSMLPPQPGQGIQNRDMGQAVSDAFLSEPVNASVAKIAWEVPEDLAYNDGFRKYLQIAGKNLKLTLSSDLLLTTEMAYSNKMIVDLKISKDGVVQASKVTVSSGSKQIDGIVLQSVNETLKYLKMPSGETNGQSVNATLIISF